MSQKKQQFRFRIPWISGPSSKSNQSSEPKSKEKVVEEPIKHGSLLTSERKMVFASSSGKDIKLASSSASSDPVIRKVSTISNDFDHKLTTVDDEKRVSVMTLAGENRGATMHASQSSRKKGSTHGEENSCSYVNSNIQSMNNSIMSHGSINGRDPGVRVILPQQPEEDKRGSKIETENRNPKGEVKIHRAERLNNVPTPIVRRRCLRGLLLEPSDSDPDKPRRHGCKVSCGEVRNAG